MSRRWCFYSVDLELTNECSAPCRFCPRDALVRPRGAMKPAIFTAVAERLCAEGADITLSGLGDPLRHPDWDGCLRTLRAGGCRAGIQLSAVALRPDTTDRLLAAGPSFVDVSLPSADPAILERLLPGCEPSALLSAVADLAAACRGRIPLTVVGVLTALEAGSSEEESSQVRKRFAERWAAHGARTRHLLCHSRGGALREPLVPASATPPGLAGRCGLLARHAFIDWQGELLACCHDLDGSTRLGSVAREPLDVLATRKQARLERVPHFELCERCDESLRRLPLPGEDPPQGRAARRRYFRGLQRYLAG